ncbi:MAG: Hsp20/alpha crystallin family protein [Desulfomonile sp.]|nr:Hsp20/alpha crystallin family protein [Desulfomonile sp.]
MAPWRFGSDPLWSEFDRLRRGMDDLFTALTGTRPFAAPRFGALPASLWAQGRLFPLLNVRQAGDVYVVTAELPGLKSEDLEINVEGDTLSLKGERKPLELSEGTSYHRRERASGKFHRSITLPNKVAADDVKATYKDGVLTIRLPIEKAVLPKHIAISAE